MASQRHRIRRLAGIVFGAAFVLIVFVLLPFRAAELNALLGWPRWRTTVGGWAAIPLFLGGVGIVLYCSGLFAIRGKGSPVPIDPPTELVVTGLYRHSRNPIYVAYAMVLLSYFFHSGELALLFHAASVILFFQGWIVWVEEPGLRQRFGDAYAEYSRQVPRWVAPPGLGKRGT